MRDGIYRIRFETPTRKATGIITLCGGRFSGTDRTHFITGHYSVSGNKLSGEITYRRHSQRPGYEHGIGLDEFHVRLNGICSETLAQFESYITERPEMRGQATFTRLCAV